MVTEYHQQHRGRLDTGNAPRVEDFEQYRRLLFAIVYRMVGTAMEAEDIVQETYLRYQSALDGAAATRPHVSSGVEASIKNLKAYLTTITTRLCLDYLKAAQTQRQSYFGIWLPEPTAGDEALFNESDVRGNVPSVDPAPSPAEIITQQESISMAFLVILEQLTPIERAVLLLRGVFDYDYAEIADMVGKSEANCRQIFRRAQAQVRSERPRFEVTQETHQAVVSEFLAAIEGGAIDQLFHLLTEDVAFASDGGGKASAALHKLIAPEKVVLFLRGLVTKGAGKFTAATCDINGRMGVLLYDLAGRLAAAFSFDVVLDENDPEKTPRIRNIYVMRNPDKLARLEGKIEG